MLQFRNITAKKNQNMRQESAEPDLFKAAKSIESIYIVPTSSTYAEKLKSFLHPWLNKGFKIIDNFKL